MDTINRKSLLYKSGLGFYAINHVMGCSHGCIYPCYAYMMFRTHKQVKTYEDWRNPKLVSNAPELLEKELLRMKVRPDAIHLCLSTDPFMYACQEVTALSLRLIEIINSFDISCSLLTKGVYPVELADRKRFPAENMHGISLVALDDDFRRKWEPGAAPYTSRIGALKMLHDYGCNTLAHIEPYPTPNIFEQDILKLLEEVRFVDRIFFGRWNYYYRVKDYPGHSEFYRLQAGIVRDFCSKNDIQCDI